MKKVSKMMFVRLIFKNAPVVTTGLLLVFLLATAAPASATEGEAAPWWHLTSAVRPAKIAPGGDGTLVAIAVNLGDGATSGPVTISELLPPGVSVRQQGGSPEVSFFAFGASGSKLDMGPLGFLAAKELCHVIGSRVQCTTPPEGEVMPAVGPYEDVEIQIGVHVSAGAGSLQTRAEVSGGGLAPASLERPLPLGSEVAFGVEDFSLEPEEEGGRVDAQAGSHPFQLTTTFVLNQTADPAKPPALPKDLHFNLPPGLIGNAVPLPQCDDLDFRHQLETANACPADTALGVAFLTVFEPITLKLTTISVPLFNLVPSRGEPARFGFFFGGTPVTLDAAVRTGSDYGVTINVRNITELTSFISSTVIFWGVPGDHRHDNSRGWNCLVRGVFGHGSCQASEQSQPVPFMMMPSSCTRPFISTVEGVSWDGQVFAPASSALRDGFGRALEPTGCNRLPFSPALEVQPDVQSASTPTGLTVHVRVPQEVSENPEGLISSSVKDTTVVLPAGMQLNPSGANGLGACSEGQVGFSETDPSGTDLFTPSIPQPFCPLAAKIATVKFKVPVIKDPLEGAVYLATQNKNPFGSLVAMYIVAEDPVSGVLVKLAGEVSLSASGQVTATLKNSPQAPLEEAEFHFFGGDRAPLATPARCGDYTTSASFTPWSGSAPVQASSTFAITSGPNGSSCPNPLPFSPTLAAGSTNLQAGAFSPLVTTISREDGNQDIQGVQLRMPPGLSGVIAGVPLCPEAQANAGSCSQASEIGHTIVSVGLGSNPYSVTGGRVFLTEGYKGAPYGLSIVNPAKAGPFDLGQVIVRAKLEVDPLTAQLTVSTDPIPHILDGIPLKIKHVNVTIDRPGFTFNPTNCSPLAITGSVSSVEGATAAVSEPFQATNCATLKFAPKFSVSTGAHTSKANGASLTARLSEPNEPQGSQANIARVKVELPKQLPSRLTTLQKACTSAQFEANPAGCPVASNIGHAKVTTPLLPVALEGPAIFVSHGGEAFPSLTMVLQGYGVTVDLVGTTFISKAGVTSTTFKTVPDVPFNTFELTLPTGPYSALTALGNVCNEKLTMPIELTAQNGMKLNQNTNVTVTGCPKKKVLTRAQKLAVALKACHKRHNHARRAACERTARRRYGSPRKRKK